MHARIALTLILLSLSCGTAEDQEQQAAQPLVTVTIAGRSLNASAVGDATPITLVLALVGPGGTRTETVDFDAHEVRLPQLQKGSWSIRGDGLDAQGAVGWIAKPVVFTVEAGKRIPISLVFELVD